MVVKAVSQIIGQKFLFAFSPHCETEPVAAVQQRRTHDMYVKPTIGTKRHLCRGVACHFLHTVEQAIFDFFTVFFRQELAVRQKLNAYFLLPLFLDYMGM